MVAKSWFRSLWGTSRKHEAGPEKMLIGVLAFEVASLMSKLVQLWQSLSDEQVAKLREEITSSEGIKNLVSDDDDYIVSLICAEMVENLRHVASAVTRLSDKCTDPFLKSFNTSYDDLIKDGADPYGWQFTWKKMDKKVKKMEQYTAVNANLYKEMETLAKLEQTLRRIKGNGDADGGSLVEYYKKVAWKQQEVRHLKEISLWNMTYNYIVHLLARSLFTIFGRVEHVFGINHAVDMRIKDSTIPDSDNIHHSHSVSALMQSSVHPCEGSINRFFSGPLGGFATKSGPILRTNKSSDFYSGPLGNSMTSSLIARQHNVLNFYSGALGKSTSKSGLLPRVMKSGLRFWQTHDDSLALEGKSSYSKPNRLTTVVPFKECMMAGNTSPVRNCHLNCGDVYSGVLGGTRRIVEHYLPCSLHHGNQSIFSSKHKLLNAPPETLGAAALALHYANVIIAIEKLVAFPNLIVHDARNNLYNMLPANVRAALREKLRPYTKILASSVCDTSVARERSDTISRILKWLAPLAHSTIRWQSERSFEHQNLVSKMNVLLVQTLHFANQEKTEAEITELLVGLNYIWRFNRELNAKAFMECATGRICDGSLDLDE